MDYPVKTPAQLRPLLQGFRKAAGLTQAAMAERLGVTQQTYARLEADPTRASVERLFRVMRVLGIEMKLGGAAPEAAEPHAGHAVPPSSSATATEPAAPTAGGRRGSDTPREDW
ncbi:helix-turn-helix transcriptional regulator [Burkholderia plantarii]|uniref:helix-turn-helix transcriptional regulator n=1 Tax=Burkholderia plantarii TaxID=41899 RepID=UPI0006D88A67|nr:helix-turn-helix transcriptional regulator [Burkholderia plantarii]ALK32738.1 transcriptional regulator, XRE family [Burkholderia plantarii]GLZ22827.1 transcriptional regulator [Burkholderia plantarii]